MLHVMIIGCGGIAPAHIEGYLEFPEDAVITVLADGNLSRAEGLIKRYGLTEAKAVADYRACLNEVDVVSICTPPALHEQMAVDALEAGCHVLLEKPMAPSLAACDHILKATQKSGKLLSVVVQSRYISSIRNAIDMVRGGAYGRALFTQINSFWHRGQHYYDLNWRGRWTVEGGGCTLNHSIHHIDLLLWAKGLPSTVVSTMHNLNTATARRRTARFPHSPIRMAALRRSTACSSPTGKSRCSPSRWRKRESSSRLKRWLPRRAPTVFRWRTGR